MEIKQAELGKTKIKYLRPYWPLIVNLITLSVYIASVRNFYSGKIIGIFFFLYLPSGFGCWLIFPVIALLQLGYSVYLLSKLKIPLFCCHLSSAIGMGICFLTFMMLLKKGFYMTV